MDRDFRKKGVASVALKAALDSIEKQGGGIVEAYPPTSKEGGSWALWFGTVAMFEREGFKAHAKLGEKHLLMRKTICITCQVLAKRKPEVSKDSKALEDSRD